MTDLADRQQWSLVVIQTNEHGQSYGTMVKFWPPATATPDDLALALEVNAHQCDATLEAITGELSPGRRWSIGESPLTPRQWSDAAKHERDEHRRDWHRRARGKEVCGLDAGDCPYLAGEEE